MRAIVCRPGRRVETASLEAPKPGPGEILLDLLACGLCGTDLHKIAHDRAVGRVLGHEVVGTVRALGNGVRGFAVGDRVVTPHHVPCGACRLCRRGATTRCPTFQEDLLDPGGFAEQIRVRERAVRHAARVLPPSLSTDAAVFLEPAACVLRGIERAGLPPATEPTTVLVLGAGSMGLLHLLVLRALRPEATVVVSEPVGERRRIAQELGASQAVSPAEVGELFGSRSPADGFDAAFDTVGAASLVPSTLPLLRSGGTLVLFAHATGERLPLPHELLFHEERRILGTYSGAVEEQVRIFDWLVAGRLRPEPLVSDRIPLSRFQTALDLAHEPQTRKVLLTPG